MMEISPCKGCTERHPACHGSCDKYKEWLDRDHAQKEHLRANRNRWERPWSTSRERETRHYMKYGPGTHKGGNQ